MKVEIIKNKSNQINDVEKDISLMEEGLSNKIDDQYNSLVDNNVEKNNVINLPKANVEIVSSTPTVTVVKNKQLEEQLSPKVSSKMRNTSFQARLGKRLDNISRKLIDNQIRLTANPTDMIRIKAVRDSRSQDLISRTITNVEIVPIILPPMEDIPMRKFISSKGEPILIPSLYPTSETTYYEIYSPLEVMLTEDDLLLRVIEDPHSNEPYILCLQVKDVLGTLGYSSLRYQKFWVSIYDEDLPKPVIDILTRAVETREFLLGW